MPTPAPPHIARRLAAAIEPFVGQVYFSPECHSAYAALGFNPSPGDANGVALPDGAAYFTSRGSVMGQVHGTVVAAAFGVFNPAVVVPAVTYGWTLTDATTICTARTDGALAQLRRILGDEPDGLHRVVQLLLTAIEPLRPYGKPLFAGISALPMPEPPLGVAWHLGDMLREYRGDAHIAAWTGAGFDPPEIGLLTELYWGLPARSYVRTRAWTSDDLDAAQERLRSRGLLEADGSAMTEAGWAAREAVEVQTDQMCRPLTDALGEDGEELVALLAPWGAEIRAQGGYLPSGPHDLAERFARH
jgi:Helix-turn-helix family